MTKELEEKAKKWLEEQDFLWLSVTETERLIKAYEAGQAELIDRCKELEQQIEKMKMCSNCTNGKGGCKYRTIFTTVCDKWEIKEK